VGFQSAADVLGVEFADTIKNIPFYIEVGDQRQQLELFFNEQVDVIIVYLNVFHNLSLELTGSDQSEKVMVHPFFAPNRYRAGFNDMKLKKQFSQTLGKYVSSGRYKTLKVKYNFRDVVPTIKRFPVD
jgi:hypothetical protein